QRALRRTAPAGPVTSRGRFSNVAMKSLLWNLGLAGVTVCPSLGLRAGTPLPTKQTSRVESCALAHSAEDPPGAGSIPLRQPRRMLVAVDHHWMTPPTPVAQPDLTPSHSDQREAGRICAAD